MRLTVCQLSFLFCIAPAFAGEAPAVDPLDSAAATSLELDPELKASPEYFPLGILGDQRFRELPHAGMNLTERSHTCYEFKDGLPCNYRTANNRRGKYFFNVWAAHTLFNSRETKHHGTLKNSLSDSGRPHDHHMLNLFDPATRSYVLAAAAATVRQVVAAGDAGAVAFWGIDNEWELPLDYSPEARQAFARWLEKAYGGDLAALNRAWGAEYPSFAQTEPPVAQDFAARPGAWLDWKEFQGANYAGFLAEYFEAIQREDPGRRPVVAKSTQCTLEMQHTARTRTLNHEMLAAATRALSQGWYGIDQYGHGDRSMYELNYFLNCIRPAAPDDPTFSGVFYGETNNHGGPAWQFAQTYWRALANGMRGGSFFVIGSFKATGDYATFGMTDPYDGTRRGRFFYASRLAAAVHRSERFWHAARPAATGGRVAILLPQRDIYLSSDSNRSWWDFGVNDRVEVFRALRDAGYFVDVIPYGKLTPLYLAGYQALVLAGAEHLSPTECAGIAAFVTAGGVLVADMRAGHFDAHHGESRGLESLLGVRMEGVYSGIEVSPDDVWLAEARGDVIRSDGRITFTLGAAEPLNARDAERNAKEARVTLNRVGKGRAVWVNTRLGTLRAESGAADAVPAWWKRLLTSQGVAPGFTFAPRTAPAPYGYRPAVRVETPQRDAAGNVVVVIAGTSPHPIPAGDVTLSLPGLDLYGCTAWFAAAEGGALLPVPCAIDAPTVRLSLPEVRTAGIVYLFREGLPFLAVAPGAPSPTATEPHDPPTPLWRPGGAFPVTVQALNPGRAPLPAGEVTLRAPRGWRVEPASLAIPGLAAGGARVLAFTVTVPPDDPTFRPHHAWPLVAEFFHAGNRLGVGHAVVGLGLDPRAHDHLLSDNATGHGDPRDFVLPTGATYAYTDATGVRDPSNRKTLGAGGRALTGKGAVACGGALLEVTFDLGKAYRVSAVRLRQAGRAAPLGAVVATCTAPGDCAPAATAEHLKWDADRWARLDFTAVTARLVRVRLTFPPTGGLLDEVEIYGRPE